jgi:hypothetical protein
MWTKDSLRDITHGLLAAGSRTEAASVSLHRAPNSTHLVIYCYNNERGRPSLSA